MFSLFKKRIHTDKPQEDKCGEFPPKYEDVNKKIGHRWKDIIKHEQEKNMQDFVKEAINTVDKHVSQNKQIPSIVVVSMSKTNFAESKYAKKTETKQYTLYYNEDFVRKIVDSSSQLVNTLETETGLKVEISGKKDVKLDGTPTSNLSWFSVTFL